MDSEKLNINDIKIKNLKEQDELKIKTGDLFQVSNKLYENTNIKIKKFQSIKGCFKT